ncbi:hypothetical protein PILCRDRAFT_617739 [Piloderma croceum F 1598]|uniref:Uncharacterized protein n=1 Tax=Piloderma croceum (strain F 1598) TaxID=765440 RepID=A0A0C3BJK0_PILCF|nr:hypothetical protein PILCRDRAFT_617739 [Piloderma croceum F 1598]
MMRAISLMSDPKKRRRPRMSVRDALTTRSSYRTRIEDKEPRMIPWSIWRLLLSRLGFTLSTNLTKTEKLTRRHELSPPIHVHGYSADQL